jgi:cytochrome b
MQDETRVDVKVWDLPIRLFHWILTLLFVFQVATGHMGGAIMKWHVWSGYAILALVLFRILWGFWGSTHARFSSFLAGPAATWRFARRLFSREAVPQLGHNPLAGWMVLALIASFLVQAVTGLFSFDGVATAGPLASTVESDTTNRLSKVHDWNVNLLLVLVALHVAAALFHWVVKREDLVTPMFTGVKRVPTSLLQERRQARRDKPPRRVASREPSAIRTAGLPRAAGLLAVAIALVVAVVTLFR